MPFTEEQRQAYLRELAKRGIDVPQAPKPRPTPRPKSEPDALYMRPDVNVTPHSDTWGDELFGEQLSSDLTKGERLFDNDWAERSFRMAHNATKGLAKVPVNLAQGFVADTKNPDNYVTLPNGGTGFVPKETLKGFATFIPTVINETLSTSGHWYELNPDFEIDKVVENLSIGLMRENVHADYSGGIERPPNRDKQLPDFAPFQKIPEEKVQEARDKFVEDPSGAILLLLPWMKGALRRTSKSVGVGLELTTKKIQDNFAAYGGDLATPLGRESVSYVRQRHAELLKANARAVEFRKSSEKGLKNAEKEDMVFAIQRTENPWRLDTNRSQPFQRLGRKARDQLWGIKQRFGEIREAVNKSGASQDVGFIKDYVSQMWRVTKGSKDALALVNHYKTNNPFAKSKLFESYQWGINRGFKPRYRNIYDILEQYERTNARVVQNNTLVRSLIDIRQDAFGEAPIRMAGKEELPGIAPVIMLPDKTVPDGYVPIKSNALSLSLGGRAKSTEIFVHPDIAKPLKTVFDQPLTGKIYHVAETINAFTKKISLAASFFHHIALTESALYSGVLPTSFIRGKNLLKDRRIRNDMFNSGLEVNAPSDIQRSVVRNSLLGLEEATRNVPGVYQGAKLFRKANDLWDASLWDYYHRGLKAYTYHSLVEKTLKKFDNLTPAEIKIAKQSVARHVNNAFGGQNWEALLKSPKWRQVAHLSFLAPDWTLSNVKIATSAFKTKRGGLGAQIEGGLARKYWVRAGLVFFSVSNLTNRALSGHWMWENEKGHEFDIDTGAKDDKGRRVFMVGSKQVREPFRWLLHPVREALNKAAPVWQIMSEQVIGSSLTGWQTEWKQRERYGPDVSPLEEAWLRGKTVAKHAVPFSMGNSNIYFTWPIRRGIDPNRGKSGQVSKILDLRIEGRHKEALGELVYWNLYFPTNPINISDVSMKKQQAKQTKKIKKKYGIE